MFEAMVT